MKMKSRTINSNQQVITETHTSPTFNEVFILKDPTSERSLVCKQYVDTRHIETKFNPGELKISTLEETPLGFLKCNGAYLNKEEYIELFNTIGYTYSHRLLKGSGKPFINQFFINEKLRKEFYFWFGSGSIPGNSRDFNLMVTNNRVYILGRNSGSRSETTVYTAPINSDGTLGTWTNGTSLPGRVSMGDCVVIKNMIYVIAGNNDNESNIVYRSTINEYGLIGPWSLYINLPFTISRFSGIITTNRLLLIGGLVNSSISNRVYQATIDTNGNLINTWLESISLPIPLMNHSTTILKNRVYVIGGETINGEISNKIFYSDINGDGTLTNWVETTPLPIPLRNFGLVVTKNRIYVIGGLSMSASNKVYSANIKIDGTLGEWEMFGILPYSVYSAGYILTNTHLYQIGGISSNKAISTVNGLSIVGGLNNYSSLNNGEYVEENTSLFRLPDYSFLEDKNMYFYIKT